MSARPLYSVDRAELLGQLNRASGAAWIQRQLVIVRQERMAAAMELARAVDVARTLAWCEQATGRRWANDQDHVRIRTAMDVWDGRNVHRRAGNK